VYKRNCKILARLMQRIPRYLTLIRAFEENVISKKTQRKSFAAEVASKMSICFSQCCGSCDALLALSTLCSVLLEFIYLRQF